MTLMEKSKFASMVQIFHVFAPVLNESAVKLEEFTADSHTSHKRIFFVFLFLIPLDTGRVGGAKDLGFD